MLYARVYLEYIQLLYLMWLDLTIAYAYQTYSYICILFVICMWYMMGRALSRHAVGERNPEETSEDNIWEVWDDSTGGVYDEACE